MPDKWSQYAVPAEKPEDKWAQYATKPASLAAAPVQPSFMQRVGTRMQGNLNPQNLYRVGSEAATALEPFIEHPFGTTNRGFSNPITNVQRSFETIAPKVVDAISKGLGMYKDPANIVGDVATGMVTHVAAGGEIPKIPTEKILDAAIKHELKKASTLNIRALKPEDMTKPTGEAVAAAKIWGTKNQLPQALRARINQNNAVVTRMAQAADAAGVTLDLRADLDSVVDAARQRPAFMGDKKALGDLAQWKQKLSQPLDPRTGTPSARQWANVKPSEALEMSRGLEKDSGWEASPPDHIQKVASEFRKKIGEKLDAGAPGVAALRRQNSGLIEAEKSAIRLRDIGVKEQGRAIVHWLSQPSLSKLAVTIGMMEILRESGVTGGSYLFAAGGAMGLRALAESMTSRTGRAVLHQEAAEILMGLRKPAASAQAPPTAPAATGGPQGPLGPPPPTGASPTPQAPISPPSAPQGPQVAQPQQLTGAVAPKPTAGPSPIIDLTTMRGGLASEHVNTTMSPKAKALADAIPELQSRYDNAKSGYERLRAQKNLEAAKAAIESGDPKEMAAVKKRLDTAARQRKFQENAKASAPAAPVTPTGKASVEPMSKALSPEQHAIALDSGLKEIAGYGKINIQGSEVDAGMLVKKLEKDIKEMEPEAQRAAVAQVLDFIKKHTKKTEPPKAAGGGGGL